MTSDGYAGRRLEILARDRARFGAGVIAELPSAVRDLGGTGAFVVTDPGVERSTAAAGAVELVHDYRVPADAWSASA